MKAIIRKIPPLLWILVTFSPPLYADVTVGGELRYEVHTTNSGVEYTLHQGWNLIGISKDLGSDSINTFISLIEEDGDSATVDSIWQFTTAGWKYYVTENVTAGTNTLERIEPGSQYLHGAGAVWKRPL